MTFLLCLIGFAVGMGLSIQTSLNGRLRQSVRSPFLTSFISFCVSAVFIAAAALIVLNSFVPDRFFFSSQPWWLWLGGLFGVTFLTGNILLFPKLGAVQTVIFPVLGQILAGLLIDQFGLFHAPASEITLLKLLGMFFVLFGVLGVVLFSNRKNNHAQHNSGVLWGWRLLGILTGACSAVQIAVNGQLGIALNSSLRAALVSFIVGTLALFVIVCFQRPKLRAAVPDGCSKNPWWMWLGGLLGALYVIGNAYIGPKIGTGTTVVVGLLGLMTAGLVIDQTGLFQSPRKPVCLRQILSLGMMFVGVCVIRLLA